MNATQRRRRDFAAQRQRELDFELDNVRIAWLLLTDQQRAAVLDTFDGCSTKGWRDA